MKLNTLLLTSAATLMATSASFAADLPSKKAAPSSGSVQVCKVAGKTGFTLPGSDTCVVLGGFVRAQVDFLGSGSGDYYTDSASGEMNAYSGAVTASVQVGAYTNTDMGVLASFIDARPASGKIDSAYLQLGGLKAGYYASTFGLMDGGPSMGWAAIAPSFKPTAQVGYSMALGNGATIGIALEQNTVKACSDYTDCDPYENYGFTTAGEGLGAMNTSLPDVVATLDFSTSMADIHIGGVYHDNNDYDSAGYAFDAGAKFKLDSIAKGDSLTVEYSYANGASDRLVNPFINVAANGYDAQFSFSDTMSGYKGDDYGLSKGYSIGARFDHNFSANLSGVVYYGYTNVKTDSSADSGPYTVKADSYRYGLALDWQPVKNFHVKPEVYHVSTKWSSDDYIDNQFASDDGSYTTGLLRIQRDF